MTEPLTEAQINEATPEELDSLVATQVMGWHRKPGLTMLWFDNSGKMQLKHGNRASRYHPSRDMTQVMQAVRAFLRQHPSQAFACQLTAGGCGWVKIERAGYTHFERPRTLDEAICRALLLVKLKEPPPYE